MNKDNLFQFIVGLLLTCVGTICTIFLIIFLQPEFIILITFCISMVVLGLSLVIDYLYVEKPIVNYQPSFNI